MCRISMKTEQFDGNVSKLPIMIFYENEIFWGNILLIPFSI